MTITQQEIIAPAVEAGMHIAPNGTVHASQSELETLVYAAVAKETQARQAAQLELEQYRNEAQQRAGVLIKEAYQRGVRDEREDCIEDVRTIGGQFAEKCEAAIRARSDK